MRRFMPRRSLCAPILLLVGLVVTGIPGYGTADSSQIDKLPPCPDPPPKTQTIPPNPDATRPPIIDPSMLVPSGDIPCNASNWGVRSNAPGATPPDPPFVGPCSEECQRMMQERPNQMRHLTPHLEGREAGGHS